MDFHGPAIFRKIAGLRAARWEYRLLTADSSVRQRDSRRNARRGFSLIEFTAVLALMAILAGVVTVNVRRFMTKGKQNAARVEIATLRDALETFQTSEGRYPSNEEGLAALARRGSDGGEAIIRQMPSDPWGRAYQYNAPGRSEPFEIICLGADGREGGSGADADIASYDLKEKVAQ